MAVAAARFGLMPPLLFGGNRRGRLGAQRRSGVQGARPSKRPGRSRSGAADTGPAHYRLAGTNGAAIDGLARDGRRAASRHAGSSSLLLSLSRRWTGLLLLQARHHVGARRDHRTRCRLSGEILAWLRAQRGSWSWRSQWRTCFGRRWRGAGDRWTRKCDGRRRHRRRGTGRRWQRLPGTRQDLARARRRKWAGRNGTRAQRRM